MKKNDGSCEGGVSHSVNRRRSPSRERLYSSGSEQETFRIAEKLSASFQGDEVVLLYGELGSGKTVFAKGIAAGLGIGDPNNVRSPSYVLVNIYQAKYPIYHIDLYRLQSEEEIYDLGWEDYLGGGILIVEWAEKMTALPASIRVSIEVQDNEKRTIRIEKPPSMPG